MKDKILFFVMVSGIIFLYISTYVNAQRPQIPTLQVCNQTKVEGKATVKLSGRSNPRYAGVFKVKIEVKCDPTGMPYPDGRLEIDMDMSDSQIEGTIKAISFEQLTSFGKHTPTAYLTGRCENGQFKGYRFWMMLVDNSEEKGTPDIIGFLIFDGRGIRIGYGTGPIVDGDISVTPQN